MSETTPSAPFDESTTSLLNLARQLREAALQAGRTDVADQMEDVVLLIARKENLTGDNTGKGGSKKADTVFAILNGLGF